MEYVENNYDSTVVIVVNLNQGAAELAHKHRECIYTEIPI